MQSGFQKEAQKRRVNKKMAMEMQIAKRTRKCHGCGRNIKEGEAVLCYGTGWYPQNCCMDCLSSLMHKATERGVVCVCELEGIRI